MADKRIFARRQSDKLLLEMRRDMKCLHESFLEYKPYLDMAIKRESRKEIFRSAVIEKTTIALVWALIVGIGIVLYDGAVAHVRSVMAAIK